MAFVKRKKYSKDIKRMFFPEDINGSKRVETQTSTSAPSVSKSWEKCGDSFLNTPVIKNLWLSGKKSAVRQMASQSSHVLPGTAGCDEELVHITWSSSESEQSDSEAQQTTPNMGRKHPWVSPQRPARPTGPIQSYSRALCMLSTAADDQPSIDWDSEPNASEDEETEGAISDCASGSCDEHASNPTAVTDSEISDYASDGETAEADSRTPNLCERRAVPASQARERSASDWVRAAQTMLQTPRKQDHTHSKTPEDSSKKRRKFQSGGLAERLNRLQCRQRSAICFWRHQPISASIGTSGDRPGVLLLEVLCVREESGMQLVLCEHQHQETLHGQQPQAPTSPGQHSQAPTSPGQPPRSLPSNSPDQHPKDPTSPDQHPKAPTSPGQHPRGPTSHGQHHQGPTSTSPGPRLLVLFTKETAAQLMPAPGDVIHVYPPWQSLVMEGEDMTAILNTHLSQKVLCESRQSIPRALLPVERLPSYSLTRTFCLLDMNQPSNHRCPPDTQVAAPHPGSSWQGLGVCCDSLLEAIEGLGQEVEVVVQRVYLSPLQERSPTAVLKSRNSSRPRSHPAMPGTRSRLCALVQDSFGMFSVVQLQACGPLPDLQLYSRRWQGRVCLLTHVKVVQRLTRERCPRLFSLIDSLWPPVVPSRLHGCTHSPDKDCRSVVPAPSFCYLLSGQEGSMVPKEGWPVSPLYRPPTRHTLRHILQNEHKGLRVSFTATVVYKRTQSQNAAEGCDEAWFVVTDPSLQGDVPGAGYRRTVALCLSPSCLLTPPVAQALLAPGACCLAVSDAVLDNGVILCVEQSVVQLHSLEEAVCNADNTERSLFLTQAHNQAHTQACSLPQTLRLDPLGPDTTANSLCSLSGVVVGVDEDTAYSWPVCSHCQSDYLEMAPSKPPAFHCLSCDATVHQPTIKMHLEAFLSSSLSDSTVKIKLQQSTIVSLLNSANKDAEFPGYQVENVLGKEVGPLTAYVRVVTRKPALWIGLEEICFAVIGSMMGPSEMNLWPQPNPEG